MNKKNIRQIGQMDGAKKVYIEDYVMTFMKQLAEKEMEYARMAVLLGEYEEADGKQDLLIYGAVEIPSGEAGVGYTMDNAAWTRVYADIKKYFADFTIMGWYLAGEDLKVEDDEWVVRFYKENFAGKDKLLFVCEPSELEETCYFYEEGLLKRQHGYCIFYERNEAMQGFLIDWNQSHAAQRRRKQLEQEQARASRRMAVRQWEDAPSESTEGLGERDGEAGEAEGFQAEQGSEPEEEVLRRIRSAMEARQVVADSQGSSARHPRNRQTSRREGRKGHQGKGGISSYLAGTATAVAVLLLCILGLQYFDAPGGLGITETGGGVQGTVSQGAVASGSGQADGTQATETEAGGVLEVETRPGGVTIKGQKEPEQENGEKEAADKEKAGDGTDKEVSGSGQPGGAGSGNVGSGNAESGNAGSGNAGSGNAESGNAGSGNVGSGNVGSGNAGSGNAGSGNAGSGSVGSGNAGSGNGEAGSAGAGNTGAGNAGSGSAGAGNAGAGNTGAGNAGSGSAGAGNAGSGNAGSGNAESGNAGSGNAGSGSEKEDGEKQGAEKTDTEKDKPRDGAKDTTGDAASGGAKDTGKDTPKDTAKDSAKDTAGSTQPSTQVSAGNAGSVRSSYVVQPGDTLSGICMAQYNTLSRMDEVMQVNNITDANGILAGDVLILP